MNVEIAQRLAELRRQNGFSQEVLAEKLGLSRQAISKWERAESSPDTDNLIALARLYKISLDELLAIEPDLDDDVAFEAQDRARQQQNQSQQTEVPPLVAASGPTSTASAAPDEAPAFASEQRSSYEVDADGCYLADNGRPYKHKSKLRTFPFPIIVVVVYLIVVFTFNGIWTWSWLIFLSIPLWYWIVAVVEDRLNKPE
jgi:transcriptional regulator with XRE-family HTH domain